MRFLLGGHAFGSLETAAAFSPRLHGLRSKKSALWEGAAKAALSAEGAQHKDVPKQCAGSMPSASAQRRALPVTGHGEWAAECGGAHKPAALGEARAAGDSPGGKRQKSGKESAGGHGKS
jgi:hypothetical protein